MPSSLFNPSLNHFFHCFVSHLLFLDNDLRKSKYENFRVTIRNESDGTPSLSGMDENTDVSNDDNSDSENSDDEEESDSEVLSDEVPIQLTHIF